MADIVRKQIATNAHLVAHITSGALLSFSLEVTGLDPVRPNEKKTVTGMKPEEVQALLALAAAKDTV